MNNIYFHTEDVHHNDLSPSEIVPVLYSIFKPKSVVDIGCGIGNFLREFKKNGVNEILGIDGPWTDLSEINKNIGKGNYVCHDLKSPLVLNKKFDLAISLEVAEHVEKKSSKEFIQTLANSSDNIVFSAAIPLQGGQNHINEQWNDYWIHLFKEKGFIVIDFLKVFYWNNPKIFWWYKQNILFFTKNPEKFNSKKINHLNNVIHPDLYLLKTIELDYLRNVNKEYIKILKSEYKISFYLKRLIISILKSFVR
jgi:SAM-dependent methyltransferase